MALTKAKNVQSRDGVQRAFGVKAATTIFAGAMVFLDGDDNAVPGRSGAAADSALVSVGIAEETVTGSAVDGEVKVPTKTGVFLIKNSDVDPVTLDRIGDATYAVDDESVGRTTGGGIRPVVGTVFDLDASGVWVKI